MRALERSENRRVRTVEEIDGDGGSVTVNFHWLRILRRWAQNLSLRAGLYCVGAIATALLAVNLSPYVPDDMAELLGGGAVDHILTILASSMLTVVTFSLSTLIASYSIAGASAPSRATSMIMNDRSAQNALSTFLGAFIFSVVALVALSTKYYGPKGRVILFLTTIFVIGAVIWTVIRWIGQLSGLGQLPNVLATIEDLATKSIEKHDFFFTAGVPQTSHLPSTALAIHCEETGFVQAIDVQSLSELAEKHKVEIWLQVHSGHFVYPQAAVAKFSFLESPKDSANVIRSLRSCFVIDKRRTFEDDPRFGLIVLSEIASRALSPGINDPGTAIEVVGSLLRVISRIHVSITVAPKLELSTRVHVWPITPEEIVDDAFQAISRDGAPIVEVGIFLQKALDAIHHYPEFEVAARTRAQISLEQSEQAQLNEFDIERLRRASCWLAESSE